MEGRGGNNKASSSSPLYENAERGFLRELLDRASISVSKVRLLIARDRSLILCSASRIRRGSNLRSMLRLVCEAFTRPGFLMEL